MGAIRVLIADDYPIVRRGLRVYLNRLPGIVCVGEARDGKEALALAERLRPDIALIDLEMPLMSGLDAIAALCKLRPKIPVIALGKLLDPVQLRCALQYGALGYLDKSIDAAQLGQAIEAVLRGQTFLPAAALASLVQEKSPDPSEQLTAREHQVLELLALGCSYEEIAQQLCISGRTVRTHTYNLRSKIGVRNRTETALFALRHVITPLAL